MQPEPTQLCTLRPEIVNLDIQDALALILNCRIVDAERFRILERKNRELADWIKGK